MNLLHCILITVALAMGLPHPVGAAPVTLWFSGTVSSFSNPSNAMPSDIRIGTPVSGRWMFDSTTAGYVAGIADQTSAVSNFYCGQVSGYSALIQIGSHNITNTSAIPGNWCGSLNIYDNYGNADELYLYSGQSGLMIDGSVVTNSNIRLYLRDNSMTAFSSAQFPTNTPNLEAFADVRTFTWNVNNPSNKLLYSVEAQVTAISTNELVLLNIQKSTADARIAWPVGISGFTLQASSNFTIGSWQNVVSPVTDIGMEHTVTVPTAGAPKFYRLKK